MNNITITCIESCIEQGKKLDLFSGGTLIKERNLIFLIILGVILLIHLVWQITVFLSNDGTKNAKGAKIFAAGVILPDVVLIILIALLIFVVPIFL